MPGISASYTALNAVIANGAALSNAVELNNQRAARLSMPAAWTAASLTFQCLSADGVTWNDLYDASGNEYTVTVDAAREVILPLSDFLSITTAIKIRSGTAAAPVNQGDERTIIVSAVL